MLQGGSSIRKWPHDRLIMGLCDVTSRAVILITGGRIDALSFDDCVAPRRAVSRRMMMPPEVGDEVLVMKRRVPGSAKRGRLQRHVYQGTLEGYSMQTRAYSGGGKPSHHSRTAA